MNTFVTKFSSSYATEELRKAQDELQEDSSSIALWGSNAGFGNVSKGVPSFGLPSLPDVRPLAFAISKS